MSNGDYFNGISYNSLLYLDVVAHHPDCTVSMLADMLKITKSGVTIKVNELVKQGYLEKTQSLKDKRVFHLSISPHINHVFDVYDNIFTAVEAEMHKRYTAKEMELFCEMLHNLTEYDWNDYENDDSLINRGEKNHERTC